MNKAGLRTIDAWTKGLVGVLPDFIILGAQKAGTGSIFDLICSDDRVLKPATKEIMYFDRYFHKGDLWYKAHFPSRFRMAKGGFITGEASPGYIYHPNVPQRMKSVLPERTKFIALLRNPIDRAYSHYKHEVRKGLEDLSFEKAIAAEPERLKEGQEIFRKNPRRMHLIRHFSYLERGYYAAQLRNWFVHFERDRFLIITTESFQDNPKEVCGQVADFLSLPSIKELDIPKSNVGNYQSSLSPETREQLREHFLPHNRELETLLNMRMNWD